MTVDPLTGAALEDIRCHRENGVDLNPYSTDGSRRSWLTRLRRSGKAHRRLPHPLPAQVSWPPNSLEDKA